MPRKAVVDAVEARLTAEWAACPVYGINEQGETPRDGGAFVQVQYPVANTRQMDLAAMYYREEGAIRLILNAPRGEDLGPSLAMVDDLAALFRSKKFDGVQTFVPSSPVIDDRNEEGMFFSLSVAVPYEHDFTDAAGFYA